jgi:hypothetical protein
MIRTCSDSVIAPDPAEGHGEQAVLGAVKLAKTNVESNDGSNETEGTPSITQA